MFESKTSGIFTLLDEECRMPNPNTKSFMQKVVTYHGNCANFSMVPSKKIASDYVNSFGFVIHHFGQEVYYRTVQNSLFENLFLSNVHINIIVHCGSHRAANFLVIYFIQE